MLNYLKYHFENKITKSSNFIIFLFIIAGLSAIIMVGIQHSIGLDTKPNLFNSWWESLTSILSIGSGDTLESRVSNFIYWCLNVAISGSIIAFITTKLSAFISNLNKGHSQIIDKNHYVIIGWNSNIFKVFEELINANLNQPKPTILCFNSMNNVKMRAKIDLEYPNQKNIRVITRSGDSYNLNELSIANLDKAKSVIVLYDELKPSYSIETSLLAIRKNIPNGDVPIISEFHDETNINVLSDLKGKNIYGVHTDSIIASVTAQSIRNKHIASVIMDFLDYDGDEIYFYPGDHYMGLTIRQVSSSIKGATLIGLLSLDNKIKLNPEADKIIANGDKIIVIAQDDDLTLSIDETLKQDNKSFSKVVRNEGDAKEKKSILVIGWSKLGQSIIENTLPMLEKGSNVYVSYRSDVLTKEPVILNQANDVLLQTIPFDQHGSSISSEFIKNKKIDTVLIIGYNDLYSKEIADTFSLMQNLQIKTVLDEMDPEERPRIILQLNNGAKKNLIDVDENNEFIVSNILSSLLMTQLAENPKLQLIFEELFTPAGCEICIKSISYFIETTENNSIQISDLINSCLDNNATFIGYIENNNLVLNPDKTVNVTITEDLKVVVICE